MHTTYFSFKSGNITVTHNSDWCGEAILLLNGQEIKLPAELFLHVAASIIRSQKINKLEHASVEEILGV